jgi:hypothetical protein
MVSGTPRFKIGLGSSHSFERGGMRPRAFAVIETGDCEGALLLHPAFAGDGCAMSEQGYAGTTVAPLRQ